MTLEIILVIPLVAINLIALTYIYFKTKKVLSRFQNMTGLYRAKKKDMEKRARDLEEIYLEKFRSIPKSKELTDFLRDQAEFNFTYARISPDNVLIRTQRNG